MGIELIEKAADAFERKQRRGLDSLDECDLFSSPPQAAIAVIAVPRVGHAFRMKDWHRLELVDGHIFVLDGISIVGEVVDAPKSVVDRMRTVTPTLSATVERVFTLSGKAELQLEFE